MSVNPLFLLSGMGMIVVGAGCVIYWALKKRVSVTPFLLGGAAWVVSVALKVGFALICNRRVQSLLSESFAEWLASPLFWLYIGLLTGVFECGLVQLLTLWSRIRQYGFDQAVAFGIGFGAMEAILLGLASLTATIAALVVPDKMPPALLQGFSGSNWMIPAPIVERFLAVILHVFACVLILHGARQRRAVYFWTSFVYKTLVDSVAAWGQLSFKVDSLSHIWTIEVIVAVFGIAGLLGLRWLSSKSQLAATEPADAR